MARKIDGFTLVKFWEDYSTKIFAGMKVSDVQYRETKRTFYAAFMTSIRAVSGIMTDDVSEEEGAVKLQELMDEAEHFAHNQTFDERKESVGEVNLKELMITLQHFLAPYDVGAHVILCTRGAGEFKFLMPSWSVAHFVPIDGGREGVRIRAKKDQHRDVEDTVRMIVTNRDVCQHASEGMQNILNALKDSLEIREEKTHITPGHGLMN